MVDSLPPSGTDPDNQTIISNSNGKLSVPLNGVNLDVGSSGKVQVFETTYYLGDFAQDSGDWTGIDNVAGGDAEVHVPSESELPKSVSVTADLTDIDVLKFRIEVTELNVKFKFDGVELASINQGFGGWKTLEIRGLDDFGANTTVTIEAVDGYNGVTGWFQIDYVRGNIIQPESRKMELVDTGGLE
jgi:hypothetical protein